MEPVKKSRSNLIVIICFLVLFLAALVSIFYKYIYTKNYDYLVEVSCDPSQEACFVRDCENDSDSCPPNNLSNYKQYYVKAYDFKYCAEDSCKSRCESGEISCEQIACDSEIGDVCSDAALSE